MRLISLLLLLPGLLPAQALPLRTARVVAEFGGPVDDPAAEMLRVDGVVRTADGRFVVANGKPLEVRLYRADGTMVRRLGREGGGPGEIRYRARVFPWPGDSVLTHSSGTDRFMLFTLDGRLVREWPADAEHRVPTGMALRGSAIVSGAITGSRGCPGVLLDRLAPRNATVFSEAMTDGAGRLWFRAGGGDRPWTVYGTDRRPIARLRLPPGFRAAQFTDTQVVGFRQDDDGFYYVDAVEPGLPAAPRSSEPGCIEAHNPVTNVRAAMIKTGMRNAMTFAEAYYADHQAYPGEAGDYPAGVKPDDTEFIVLKGGGDAFIVSIVDVPTGWRCIVSVGSGAAGPLPDGYLLCG